MLLHPQKLVSVLALILLAVPMRRNPGSIASAAPPEGTLREYADRSGFYIGSLLQPVLFPQPGYREVLGREFNSVVSFLAMKNLEPAPGQFNWTMMDRDVQFARAHNQRLFGVPLIYRAGAVAPDWLALRRGGDFGRSPAEFDKILQEWIETVVRRGGEDYYAWEVVNEPLSNPNQPWQNAFGPEEYIAKAFRYAREASPSAALVLNQTFGHSGVDRGLADNFFDLIERLKRRGVPVDVAGNELHLELQELHPDYLDELRYFLDRARRAHVQVYITEMDLYQGPEGAIPNPFERQKQVYHDVLATCLADSNCKGFTTWGLTDARSWLQAKQREPHPDAKPLLFDAQYQKKPAYFGVLEALRAHAENPGRRP